MKLYLVRHGESEANATGLLQGGGGNLTDKGRQQAEFLARRFKNIQIDTMVVSTLARAKQTAEIINQAINKPVSYNELFRERKNPSEFVGQQRDSSLVKDIHRQMNENYSDEEYHYSDEENFFDQKKRALQALDFLKNLNQENILVVTHGVFMRMVVACAIFGPELSPETFWRIMLALRTSNTSITILETNDSSVGLANRPEWTLLTWNDHAHLG